MKTLSVLLFTVISAACTFGWACQPEAQIIASVGSTRKLSSTSCLITVEAVQQFNSSFVCPLVIGEIGGGIEVGTNSNHECAFEVGEVISGVLYRDAAGAIILE